MTRTERIEAAARAMADARFRLISNADLAKIALTAAFPELMSSPPSGWVAPMEATEAMVEAVYFVMADDEWTRKGFAVMRDAHLKDNPS